MLEKSARDWPGRGFYRIAGGSRLTDALLYPELLARAGNLARQLKLWKLPPGSRILIPCPHSLDFLVDFWACWLAGMSPVPVPAPQPGREQRTLPRIGLIEQDCQAAGRLQSGQWHASSSGREAGSGPTGLALLQYTSGSTRHPRGCCVTADNLLHNLGMLADFLGHPRDMVMLHWLPLFHDMGLIRGLLSPLSLGADVYLMDPLEFVHRPRRWLEGLSHFRATCTGAPNFGFGLTSRKGHPGERLDLSSVRLAFCSAEPIRAATLDEFSLRFSDWGWRPEAIRPSYGLAEATLVVSGEMGSGWESLGCCPRALAEGRIRPGNHRLVSCGQVLGHQTVRIVAEGRLCAPEQVGEIWLQGPSVTQGYWGLPEQTRETFGAFIGTEGPYLRTGDLGFLHQGRLFVTGRVKELIVLRGQNFYPQDLEEAVLEACPGLRPGCIAAFQEGERLVLLAEAAGPADWARLGRRAWEQLGTEFGLSLKEFQVLPPGSLLKTSSGKLQRRRVSVEPIYVWTAAPQA